MTSISIEPNLGWEADIQLRLGASEVPHQSSCCLFIVPTNQYVTLAAKPEMNIANCCPGHFGRKKTVQGSCQT